MKIVISASRRTDLPAFHYTWLQNMLAAGQVTVPNPRFPTKRYHVDLNPDIIHSLVLWSKDFKNVLQQPMYLNHYRLYFQYTINNYAKTLEPFAPDYAESLQTLEGLLKRYHPTQFNIRFDPVIISLAGEHHPTPDFPAKARLQAFTQLCRDLSTLGMQACRITTSFLALYKHVPASMNRAGFSAETTNQLLQHIVAAEMVAIAASHGMELHCCSSPILENVPGIQKGSCIDGQLLQSIFGGKVSKARDSGQRDACGCTKSSDIGSYHQLCAFHCRYCYAQIPTSPAYP